MLGISSQNGGTKKTSDSKGLKTYSPLKKKGKNIYKISASLLEEATRPMKFTRIKGGHLINEIHRDPRTMNKTRFVSRLKM